MKKLLFLFFFIPFLSISQKENLWHLYVNEQIFAKGKVGELKRKFLSNKTTKTIKLKVFPAKHLEQWTISYIIMDSNRIELSRKETNSSHQIEIEKSLFIDDKKKRRSVIIYIVQTPSDPRVAQTIRILPQQIVKITLRD